MHSLSRVAMLAGGVNMRATYLFFRRYMQSVCHARGCGFGAASMVAQEEIDHSP